MAASNLTVTPGMPDSFAWLPGMAMTPEDRAAIEAYLNLTGAVSSIVTEALYVIDLVEQQFVFVTNHVLLLCGYSMEEALEQGFSFFRKILYPDDLPLVIDMYRIVCNYMQTGKCLSDEVDYFACTFRIWFPAGREQFHPLMVYHRLKPLPIGGQMRYAVGSMNGCVIEMPGNLRLYCRSDKEYESYDHIAGQWKRVAVEPLTDREKIILMLSQQGKTGKDIANRLCIAHKTVRNAEASIYRKLGVHSMKAAILHAANHRIMFHADASSADTWKAETPGKDSGRTRRTMTPDTLLSIQQGLTDGHSIRSLARQEGVAESAIRYAVKQGRLTKPQC